MYLNNVQLKGFIGKDVEVKYSGNGTAVTTLSVATKSGSGRGENRKFFTEWHKVVLWGKRALAAADLKKGTYVSVQGELRSSEYEGKSGKVRTYEIVANRDIELPERPAKAEPTPAAPEAAEATDAAALSPNTTKQAEAAIEAGKPRARRKRTAKS